MNASDVSMTSALWMPVEIFLADALEDALRAGALDLNRDVGIFRPEQLGELFGDRHVGRGVEDDLAFALAAASSSGVIW